MSFWKVFALSVLLLPVYLSAQDSAYSSALLPARPETTDRIYSIQVLRSLRRSVPPRYVRILDWQAYGAGQPVLKKGILFTYAAYQARRVFLAGDFNNWQLMPMERSRGGVFYTVLSPREIEKGQRIDRYRYKFRVDGLWVADPGNRTYEDDGMGGTMSVYYLEGEDVNKQTTVRILSEESPGKEKLVEFSVYKPAASNISLVGNFNRWNPEHDILDKGEDGVFRLRLRLGPGEYLYRLVVDGVWQLDPYNPDTRGCEGQDLCSYFAIEQPVLTEETQTRGDSGFLSGLTNVWGSVRGIFDRLQAWVSGA